MGLCVCVCISASVYLCLCVRKDGRTSQQGVQRGPPPSVFFANCGSYIVFHIPMTDHFFGSPNSLAFQQLFHARNSQSAL